MKLTISFAQNR